MTDHEAKAKEIVERWNKSQEYGVRGLINGIAAALAERDAEIAESTDEIERCCKELGDAGILITQGPRDGIVKLINELAQLKAEIDKEAK